MKTALATAIKHHSTAFEGPTALSVRAVRTIKHYAMKQASCPVACG